jgi:hypothetical protein
MVKIYGKYDFNKNNLVEITDMFDDETAKNIGKKCAKMRETVKYLEDYVIDQVIDSLSSQAALKQYYTDHPNDVMYAIETKHGRTTFYVKMEIQESERQARFVFKDISVYQDGMMILNIPDFYSEVFFLKSSFDILNENE